MAKIVVVILTALGLLITSYVALAFVIANVDPLYRNVALNQAGEVAAASSNDDISLAEDVLAYVVENTPVPPGGVDGDPEFPSVIDDHAWGTLVRGRAYCDSQAMAVVQLLETVGLEGQLLFLYNEDGVSPHSVATVRFEDEWFILDPLYGAIPVDERGNWLSVDAMKAIATNDPTLGYQSSRPRQEQGYGDAFVPSSWFIDAAPFYESGPSSTPTTRRVVERGLAVLGPALWPGVQVARQTLVGSPEYLPNIPQDGDDAYERARTALLVGDTDWAESEFLEAVSLGSQWQARITPALEQSPISTSSLLVPLRVSP